MERKRILLFSEGVTLSQIVRLVTLGRSLDEDRFEVSFACSDFDERIFSGTGFTRYAVNSLDPARVLRVVKRGQRLYDEPTLRRQLAEDLHVFERARPDLVVGDFRWSLAVSAPLYGVPHAALVNAYWSPYVQRSSFPVPDHPIVRLLGEKLTARYFPVALPRVFEHFAKPLDALRRAHGLAPLGGLLEVLTHGDYTLYADPPELVPTPGAPPTHVHLGFVPWAPDMPLPPALQQLPLDRPVVYATLGSSGSIDVLPRVVEALRQLPVTGVVATAGRARLHSVPANVILADYLPGDVAARRSVAVVSNGGSSTSYQALAEGTPVLGLPSNLDQFLAMQAVEQHSAGISLPARAATTGTIRNALHELLSSAAHRQGAHEVQQMIERTPAGVRFREFVERVTGATDHDRASAPRAQGTRVGRGLAALALAISCLSAPPVHADASPSSDASGEIRFTSKVPKGSGYVICALFREPGWLKKPVTTRQALLRDRKATCVFREVQPDTYAIVAFHDENGNGDIDKNFLGLPTESWCTSRNARAVFGPPSFAAAKFVVRTSIQQLECTM